MASWASTSQSWSGANFTWAEGEYSLNVSAIFDTVLGSESGQTLDMPVSATLSNSLGNSILDADQTYGAIFGNDFGAIASATKVMTENPTFSLGSNIKNNINFPEAVTLGLSNSVSSNGAYLWSEESEYTSDWIIVKESGQ